MATFQNIVMIAATIILVISLCFIGLALHRQKYRSDYPPVIANCPDYWLDASGTNGAECKNYKDIGNPSCEKTMDFSKPQWSGQGGLCSKYKWAKQCNLSWDGITNNAEICGA
jgi:hypothetical protein